MTGDLSGVTLVVVRDLASLNRVLVRTDDPTSLVDIADCRIDTRVLERR